MLQKKENRVAEISETEREVDNLRREYADTGDVNCRKLLASSLFKLAYDYGAIGDHRKCISTLEEALGHDQSLYSNKPSPALRLSLAETLNNLGNGYGAIGDHRKAVSTLEEALGHKQALYSNDPSTALRLSLASTLNNLGNAYGDIGDHRKRISKLDEALGHKQALYSNDPSTALRLSLASTLYNLGNAYRDIGDQAQRYRTAKPAFELSNDFEVPKTDDHFSELHCRTSHGLSLTLSSVGGNASLSIVLSKLAVNELLKLRGLNKAMGEDHLGQMMKGFDPIPEFLVQLLVREGRFGEASYVARLAKIAEAQGLGQRFRVGQEEIEIAYTELEKQVLEIIKSGVSAERALAELDELIKKDGDVDAPDLIVGWIGEAQELFRREETAHKAEIERRNEELLRDLRDTHILPVEQRLNQKLAVLMYLVAEDELIIIATTADRQEVFRQAIKREAVAEQVFDLRANITGRLNFVGASEALCKLLFPDDLNRLLEGMGLVLISALDVVRQVPFAALYDGKRYLIQRFAFTLITEAGRVDMTKPLAMDWDKRGIAGFAVTKAHKTARGSYAALPHAGEEVDGIIAANRGRSGREAGPRTPEQSGLYPGTRDKDEAFTHDCLTSRLTKAPRVIHLATHFTFNDVHEASSSMLLGDGSELTLFDMAEMQFPDCDMVVLSACETARTSGRREKPGAAFEGLAGIIQSRGAKSVMASLWPVADKSTSQLMQRFYQHCKTGLPPALALQAAQLSFIAPEHAATPSPAASPSRSRRVRGLTAHPQATHTTQTNPLSHPFNWAPFILTGNPG